MPLRQFSAVHLERTVAILRRVDSARRWLGFRILGGVPMEASEIESVVLDALNNANRARESSHHLVVSPDAVIFGPGSPLDSLGLVALLMDIEDGLRDRGVDVNLSDPRAVSASRSPFRDVPSLVRFIGEIVEPAA